jgi:uncharacterized protein involved in exopolysaccharide biosynthesis
MDEAPPESGRPIGQVASSSASGDRFVYLLPEQALAGVTDNAISLRQLWDIVWRGKWFIVICTAIFAVLSVTYAMLATEWYRADVLLAPAEERSTPALGGQLGGLAALAGVTVGGGDSVQAVATLKSREFARDFIEDFGLLQVLFAGDWDEDSQSWAIAHPADWPDTRDAVRYFHKHVLSVSEDIQTGLVTLSIEWKAPDLAAEWADVLARRLNARLRERALAEAGANVAYLQEELAQTSLVTLQQSIGRLLESELQKLMLARGNHEFAFRIVDPAQVPKKRERPKRAMIVVIGTMLGGTLGVFLVFLIHALRRGTKSASEIAIGSRL